MQKHFVVFWVTQDNKCVLCWILIKKKFFKNFFKYFDYSSFGLFVSIYKINKIYDFFLLNSSIRDYVDFSWKQTLSWWIKFFVLSHNLFQLISNRFFLLLFVWGTLTWLSIVKCLRIYWALVWCWNWTGKSSCSNLTNSISWRRYDFIRVVGCLLRP